jgi:hypothetical protein
MLAENPSTLSLFEFFTGLDPLRRFDTQPVSGKRFRDLISQDQPFVTAVLRRGYEVAEITYPFATGRYKCDDKLPWILVAVLPRLSGDPDALFDEVVALASSLPEQPLSVHYRQLFGWLATRMDTDHWIERSGSSIDYLGSLHTLFPTARFVHIHRDGHEAALSMREHHAYRLPISLLYGAPTDCGKQISEIGPLDLDRAPTEDDAVSQILASRPAAKYFGYYWTDQVLHGFRALRRLNADQYLEVRFEDLVTTPEAVLRAISEFFALDPDRGSWISHASHLVRGLPPTRFDQLPRGEQEELAQACRPGQRLLGRA